MQLIYKYKRDSNTYIRDSIRNIRDGNMKSIRNILSSNTNIRDNIMNICDGNTNIPYGKYEYT